MQPRALATRRSSAWWLALVVLLVVASLLMLLWPFGPGTTEQPMFLEEGLSKGLFYSDSPTAQPQRTLPPFSLQYDDPFDVARLPSGTQRVIYLNHVTTSVPLSSDHHSRWHNFKELQALKRVADDLVSIAKEGGIVVSEGVSSALRHFVVDVSFEEKSMLRGLRDVIPLNPAGDDGLGSTNGSSRAAHWDFASSFLSRLGINGTRYPTLHHALRSVEEHIAVYRAGSAEKVTGIDTSHSVLWTFQPLSVSSFPTVAGLKRFYQAVLAPLVKAKAEAIAVKDATTQEYKAFVFPADWVPDLQLHGALVADTDNAVGGLLAYNLAYLSNWNLPVVSLDFKDFEVAETRTAAVFPPEDPEASLVRAWNQIQVVDAYWGLHPGDRFSEYRQGLINATRFCTCGNDISKCVPKLRAGAIASKFAGELVRSCLLSKQMRDKHVPATLGKIPAKLHPTFALGEFRDFRNFEACSNKFANFRSGTKYMGLVSYPRSGNTWVRNLLEKASSIITGSVFYDSSLVQAGLLGEGVQKETLMVKDHYPAFKGQDLFREPMVSKLEGVVLVVRNPFSSISSFYHYVETGGKHVVNADQQSGKWRKFALDKAKEWGRWHRFWVHKAPKMFPHFPILMLKYEDMVEDPVTVLRKILTFAGVEFTEGKLRCASVMPCKKERACRARDKAKEKDPYTADLRRLMLAEFKDIMTELGYT